MKDSANENSSSVLFPFVFSREIVWGHDTTHEIELSISCESYFIDFGSGE